MHTVFQKSCSKSQEFTIPGMGWKLSEGKYHTCSFLYLQTLIQCFIPINSYRIICYFPSSIRRAHYVVKSFVIRTQWHNFLFKSHFTRIANNKLVPIYIRHQFFYYVSHIIYHKNYEISINIWRINPRFGGRRPIFDVNHSSINR